MDAAELNTVGTDAGGTDTARSEPRVLEAAPAKRVETPREGTARAFQERTRRRWFDRSSIRAASRRDSGLGVIREGQRTRAVLSRDTRVRRSLGVADVAAAVVALGAAILIHGQRPALGVLAAPPLIILFCKLARLYDRDEHVVRKTTLDEAPALLQVATIYSLITWLASGAFLPGGLDKTQVAVTWVLLLFSLVVFRTVARQLAVHAMPAERMLVLGGAEPTERLRLRLETAHSLRAVVVGRVALKRGDREAPEPLGMFDDLDYLLRHHAVERVIIAPTEGTSDEMLDTIRLVKALGVKVSVLPRLFEVVGSSMEFDDIDGITVLGLRRYGLTKTSWYVKRTFDVVCATAGLVSLAPMLLVISVAVRISSSGPILFRQPRVGRRGERFQMFKFRTMYDGADDDKATLAALNEAAGLFKVSADPRVTPVGRVLRRASFDELPQLINVLRGEMSLVGPRPLVEDEDRKITGLNHRRREGTPGMTGVWQVLGPTRVSLEDMVKLDYLYRANWSLWLDLKILLRTAAHILSGRGI
jgi:exopolysaccharide biosynthesis polyprenyl glycosylphosphotransferase